MKITSARIERARDHIRDVHVDDDYFKTYYELAERPRDLETFWSPQSVFFPFFEKLDLTETLELACGHGRHSAQIVDQAGSLTLVDINLPNIEFAKKRFVGRPNVACLVNNGQDLSDLNSCSFTSVFSYDAMVHFEAMDTIAYIFEIFRVLKPQGRALLHYSVNERNPEGGFHNSDFGRNFFSESLMRHIANRAGFNILDRTTFIWFKTANPHVTDGLILLEKP